MALDRRVDCRPVLLETATALLDVSPDDEANATPHT